MNYQSKQVIAKDWMLEHECAPGQKYSFWFNHFMEMWDRDWNGYWKTGTYGEGVLLDALRYAKEKNDEL